MSSGAKYVIAQYCYDNNFFFKYVEKCRAQGITVPIIPGIMPVYSIKLTNMLCKLCGAVIPEEMAAKLESLAQGDKNEVAAFGTDFAVRQCAELLEHGVDGLHFYTMDRSKSVTEIVNRLRGDNLL